MLGSLIMEGTSIRCCLPPLSNVTTFLLSRQCISSAMFHSMLVAMPCLQSLSLDDGFLVDPSIEEIGHNSSSICAASPLLPIHLPLLRTLKAPSPTFEEWIWAPSLEVLIVGDRTWAPKIMVSKLVAMLVSPLGVPRYPRLRELALRRAALDNDYDDESVPFPSRLLALPSIKHLAFTWRSGNAWGSRSPVDSILDLRGNDAGTSLPFVNVDVLTVDVHKEGNLGALYGYVRKRAKAGMPIKMLRLQRSTLYRGGGDIVKKLRDIVSVEECELVGEDDPVWDIHRDRTVLHR
ncbi:hypothetical protein PLICRDRAFT_615167 [Plicaturopsis crispa FD-325 SS-3]|nr:hypothetical protein PLICRDRAFT_615167 [Plicaturopsis crispa FD-325 SS-3]